MKRFYLLALGLMACSGEENNGGQGADTTADSVAPSRVFVDPAELPDMPSYPRAGAGRLRVVSVGPVDLANDTPADAGLCRTPSMLIMQARGEGRTEGESWGAIMLLQVPPENRTATYPVTHVDHGFPEAPASTMALEMVSGQGGVAFQALQGFVEVSEFGETISGRFQLTVREINTEDLIQLAGVFSEVSVQELPALDCNTAAMLEG